MEVFIEVVAKSYPTLIEIIGNQIKSNVKDIRGTIWMNNSS